MFILLDPICYAITKVGTRKIYDSSEDGGISLRDAPDRTSSVVITHLAAIFFWRLFPLHHCARPLGALTFPI